MDEFSYNILSLWSNRGLAIILFVSMLYSFIYVFLSKKKTTREFLINIKEIPFISDNYEGKIITIFFFLFLISFFCPIMSYFVINLVIISLTIFFDILRYKHVLDITWRKVLFKLFQRFNKLQIRTNDFLKRFKHTKYPNIILFATIIIWGLIACLLKNLAVTFILFFVLWAIDGLIARNSARKLLRFWISCCIVTNFVTTVLYKRISPILEESNNPEASQFILLIFFTLVLSFLWVNSTIISDDEAAKVALIVVNSFTTILLILLQAAVLTFSKGEVNTIIWTAIQFSIISILLPFVVSGYIALTVKEAQIYVKKKTIKNNNRTIYKNHGRIVKISRNRKENLNSNPIRLKTKH